MRIYVSREDIKNGKRGCNRHCPIANAISRRGFTNVTVGTTGCGFAHSGDFHNTRYLMTDKASKFVLDFDSKREVQSFHLYLSKEKSK